MKLLLTGGYPRKDHASSKEGFRYEEAFVNVLDWDKGEFEREFRYKSPPEYSDPCLTQQFKSGTLIGRKLIVPSNIEILFIDIDTFEVSRTITMPSFTDLHHVACRDNKLYVANTGAETVHILDMEGNVLNEYPQVDNPTWKQYGESPDLRLIASTKPHFIHLNFIFFLEGQPWITRFQNRDAVSLFDKSKKIDLNISEGRPHDGHIVGDYIYFTLTDGHIIIVNKNTLEREEIINLNNISNNKLQLGWCRGIEIIDDQAYVGFSRLRRSKIVEYGSWIIQGRQKQSACITQYDLVKKELIKKVELGEKGGAIFTVRHISE